MMSPDEENSTFWGQACELELAVKCHAQMNHKITSPHLLCITCIQNDGAIEKQQLKKKHVCHVDRAWVSVSSLIWTDLLPLSPKKRSVWGKENSGSQWVSCPEAETSMYLRVSIGAVSLRSSLMVCVCRSTSSSRMLCAVYSPRSAKNCRISFESLPRPRLGWRCTIILHACWSLKLASLTAHFGKTAEMPCAENGWDSPWINYLKAATLCWCVAVGRSSNSRLI